MKNPAVKRHPFLLLGNHGWTRSRRAIASSCNRGRHTTWYNRKKKPRAGRWNRRVLNYQRLMNAHSREFCKCVIYDDMLSVKRPENMQGRCEDCRNPGRLESWYEELVLKFEAREENHADL